jgi:Holliday junction resolvase
MSGRRSRDKGNREERLLVRILQELGFAAERVPLSGAARGRFSGDLSVPLLGHDMRVESKVRSNGFREIYKWLESADLLIVRADRREPLVVLPLTLAIEIARVAEQRRVTS